MNDEYQQFLLLAPEAENELFSLSFSDLSETQARNSMHAPSYEYDTDYMCMNEKWGSNNQDEVYQSNFYEHVQNYFNETFTQRIQSEQSPKFPPTTCKDQYDDYTPYVNREMTHQDLEYSSSMYVKSQDVQHRHPLSNLKFISPEIQQQCEIREGEYENNNNQHILLTEEIENLLRIRQFPINNNERRDVMIQSPDDSSYRCSDTIYQDFLNSSMYSGEECRSLQQHTPTKLGNDTLYVETSQSPLHPLPLSNYRTHECVTYPYDLKQQKSTLSNIAVCPPGSKRTGYGGMVSMNDQLGDVNSIQRVYIPPANPDMKLIKTHQRNRAIRPHEQVLYERHGANIDEEKEEDGEKKKPSQEMNILTSRRKYGCLVCEKRFTRPSTLRAHMNSHSGVRPHSCPSNGCGWRFTVLSNLKRHLRVCTNRSRDEIDTDAE